MTLRRYLSLLALATLLPLAIFAGLLGYFLVQQDRETFRAGAEARALAMITAIDTALAGDIAALQALSTLPGLAEGDIATFRARAERVLATRYEWMTINLALPSGQQVMNLAVPPGQPLPDTSKSDPRWSEAVQRGMPSVSNLVVGPVVHKWTYGVRVPIVRDGSVKYVVSAVVAPQVIQRLLAQQDLPANWVGVVLDREDRIVARTVAPEKSVGELASPSLRAALATSGSGWFRGSTIEGSPVYTPFRRSSISGWAFAMGIPAAAVDGVGRRVGAVFGGGFLAALLLALAAARLAGRKLAQPIAALGSATNDLGRRGAATLKEPAIDELAELQRTLTSSMRALRESDRAKGEFLAVLSHELRNPLAALSSAAHVVKVAPPGHGAAAKARAVIERQTKHMAHLVADLLDIGRITAGKIPLRKERLDLQKLVAEVIGDFRRSGRLENRPLRFDGRAVWIDADRARAQQMATNLIDNALKFTPERKGVTVTVRPEGREAVLQVVDEGEGLEAGAADRLFELFAQGSAGAERGGMGVGLTVVKQLAELHGGSVEAASEGPGRGAAFTIRLPRAREPAEHPSDAAAKPAQRRVLIVEDNADARAMLAATLETFGHEVLAAADGPSGIAIAGQSNPDIVILDIGLPGIDGYEVARRMRALPGQKEVRIVALSGYAQPEDRRRGAEAGFDAHLAKPVSVDHLQDLILELR